MTRERKIELVAFAARVTLTQALAYLQAEEWNVDDAIESIRVDRRGGLLS